MRKSPASRFVSTVGGCLLLLGATHASGKTIKMGHGPQLGTVAQILDSTSVRIRMLDPNRSFYSDRMYPVASASDGVVVGYVSFATHSWDKFKIVRILSLVTERLIVPGDRILDVDLSKVDENYHGQTNLLIRERDGVAAAYVPPVYYGAIAGQTAATLRRGEQLVDIAGIYGYGVTDRLSLAARVLPYFAFSPNIGVKYRFIDNDTMTVSPYFGYIKDFKNHTSSTTATLYVDLPSGKKLISHTSIRWVYQSGGGASQDLAFISSSEIRTGYAYVFDNWDRFLAGPSYNLNTGKLGGYLAYMFVFKRLHLVFGVSTIDFTKIKIAGDAYVPFALAFWRF